MNMVALLSTNPCLFEDGNISAVPFLAEGADRTISWPVDSLLSEDGAIPISMGSENETISWSVNSLSSEDGTISWSVDFLSGED